MKKITLMLAALMISVVAGAQKMYVGSYNIRCNNDTDVKNDNGWKQRCPVICDFINFEEPVIFGTQEVLNDQLQDMTHRLPSYNYIGVGRDDGKTKGEYAAIFYKKKRLRLLKNGDFWLSETPDKPSFGWDAACIRICTWGQFQDEKTKLKFFFFNLHMDHVGVTARRESAKLVIAKIKEIAKGAPVILTGDFNVDQRNEIIGIFSKSGILKDSYDNARQRFAAIGTWNDFLQEYRDDSRIDHIFVSPQFDVLNYGILTNSYWSGKERRNPSDHYPVMVKLKYRK